MIDPDSPLALSPGNIESEPSPLSSVDDSAVVPDSMVAALTSDNSNSNQNESLAPNGAAMQAAGADSQETRLAAGADTAAVQISILQSSINAWRVIALMLLALWLVSIALYWWRRRRDVGHGEAVMAGAVRVGQSRLGVVRNRANAAYRTLTPLAAVESACMGTDPAAVRGALLEWASRQWPQEPPQTLTALASMLDDGVARQLIQALDASLYSRAQDSTANADLMTRLSALPKAIAASSAGEKQTVSAESHVIPKKSSGKYRRGLPDL